MRKIATGYLKYQRTEEEKLRRRIHGDKGNHFKIGKVPVVDYGNVGATITTLVTHDFLLVELYEADTDN